MRIITNLYWNQTPSVHTQALYSNEIKIKHGLRQGCVLLPMLFSAYSEALDDIGAGIDVIEECNISTKYADHMMVFAGRLSEIRVVTEH